MAADVLPRTTPATSQELHFSNRSVSLCLLVNRRAKTFRIIDFRAGATIAKRNFVVSAAQREGIEKIFTVVERDDVPAWAQLGFTREGNIPGFYRRSDAWIMGATVKDIGPVHHTLSIDDLEDLVVATDSPVLVQADRTLTKAKKAAKDIAALSGAEVFRPKDADVKKALLLAEKSERTLSGFELFSRDGVRSFLGVKTKGFELLTSLEVQPSFQNGFLELLTAPRTEKELAPYAAAIASLGDTMKQDGILTTFSMVPSDDALLTAAFLANGYRRSAVLASHMVVGSSRKDACIWAKRFDEN